MSEAFEKWLWAYAASKAPAAGLSPIISERDKANYRRTPYYENEHAAWDIAVRHMQEPMDCGHRRANVYNIPCDNPDCEQGDQHNHRGCLVCDIVNSWKAEELVWREAIAKAREATLLDAEMETIEPCGAGPHCDCEGQLRRRILRLRGGK